jgi:ABC-type sugar transport system permease subunit
MNAESNRIAPAGRPAAAGENPGWSMARSDARFGVLLSARLLIILVWWRSLYSLWMSLAEVNLLRTTGPALELFGVRLPLFRFVGLENYIRVFSDPLYWSSLGRTVYFVAAFVVEATLVGLGMALVLHQRFRGRPLMRAVLLIPWALSRVAVGILWQGLLDADFGALNGILHRLGLIDSYIGFFANGFSALNVLVSVYMWNQAPFATVLFLAGLQAIPEDLHASAAVDGAGFWRELWYVVLPALKPMIFLVVVLCTVNGFLMLDLTFVMTMGGPGDDTTSVAWLGYKTAFVFFKFGPGTAILYTLTALCVLLTFVYQRLLLARFEPERGVAVRAVRHAGTTRRLAHRVVLAAGRRARGLAAPARSRGSSSGVSYRRNLLARPFTLIPPESPPKTTG